MATAASSCEADESGLLLLMTVDGISKYVINDRAGERERRAAATQLAAKGYAILDGFLGAPVALRLREQALSFYDTQPTAFASGAVGGGVDGEADTYKHAAVRGDKMVILASDDARVPLTKYVMARFDELLDQLGRDGPGACADLQKVDHRSSPMLAIYPGGGSRYMKHIDNPDGNGRLATLLYYLNPTWVEGDGGELRIWQPDEATPAATIAPLLDRAVVFWSDERCPHEVLPSLKTRLAISVWFHTPDEDDHHGGGGTTEATAAAAMRAVAAAAAATGDDRDAWARAKVLAEGKAEDVKRQQSAEEAYSEAIRTSARTLRANGHVPVRVGDPVMREALASLRGALLGRTAPTGTVVWASDDAGVVAKVTILLHQLLPSRGLAAGCTKLFFARASGEDVRWISKPRGAKALVLTRLGLPLGREHDDDIEEDDGCATVHSRRRALSPDRPPPGWPREAGGFVLLEHAACGTLHAFDCATHPLHVRLVDVDVCGLWTFGADDGADDLARRAEGQAQALPDS